MYVPVSKAHLLRYADHIDSLKLDCSFARPGQEDMERRSIRQFYNDASFVPFLAILLDCQRGILRYEKLQLGI